MSQSVVVTKVPDAVLAQPLVDFLEHEGITARALGDDCGGVDPALNFVHGVRIIVAAEDADRARELIADFFSANEGPLPAELTADDPLGPSDD